MFEDPVIKQIAAETGSTPAVVLLAWGIQRGTSVLPKSVTPERIVANLTAAKLRLSDDQMRRINALGSPPRRFINLSKDINFDIYLEGEVPLKTSAKM